MLDSFHERDTFFVTSTRELYCLIPSTGGIHPFITSTKEVILLGSFYKRRYYSWSFGRRYIAWFLLQEEEVPPLLVTSTGGDYIACSLLQEEAQLPADLSEAERCLGLVILSAGSLSCPLSLSKLPIFQCATATHNRLSDTSYTIKGLQLLGTLAL